jgi:TolA-binding protein
LREERHAQMAQGSDTRVTSLRLGRYQSEYRRVDESPGWATAAYFKIAEAYMALGRQDEARTVARHLVNFTKGEPRQQAWYLMVSAFLDQAKGDEALAEFTAFQEVFGNDVPIAQMAGIGIGQVFLLEGRFEEALAQFTKNLEEYPKGDGVEEATRWQVTALYYLDRYEESLAAADTALATFHETRFRPNFLYFKALSEAGLGAFEEAVATIDEVIQSYPDGTPEFDTPDDAFFQKAWMLMQMERHEDAAALFREFIDRYGDSPLQPQAKYYLAVAMDAAGDQEGAFDILRDLAADDPAHELAPVALYQIAISHYENEEFEKMGAALRDVVETFPSSPISAEALFWQGWLHRQDERFDDAMDSYRKSIELLPDGELAPEAMLSIARSGEEKAGAMGLPTVLPEEKRETYRITMLDAVQAYEELLSAYPEADQVQEMPEGVADIYSQLVRARQMTPEDVEVKYGEARAQHAGDARATAFLDASAGSFLAELEGRREDALGAFRGALEAGQGIALPPSVLSRYAEVLKEENELAEAAGVYRKILEDNPDDERVCAPALFGLGDIKYRQNDFEGAKELFARVLEQYPWYEEGKKGRVLLARILEKNEQFAEAEQMFTEVWQEERGEARIGAMLGVSRCQLALAERAKQSQDSGAWSDNIEVADQNLTRIIVLYEAFPEYVAEALWFKGRAHELNGDPDSARTNAYEILLRDYPDSRWAKKAQERK